MSDLEKEELISRVKGMSEEEQRVVAMNIPCYLLFEALYKRYLLLNAKDQMITSIAETKIE